MADAKKEAPKQAETKTEDNAVKIPDLKPGMTIRIYQRIKEQNIKGEEKERVQYFEGIIIALKHKKEIGATITVYKETDGVGVEKIYPLNLPTIEKIVIKKIATVRKAKLGFLKQGYKKKLKEKIVTQ